VETFTAEAPPSLGPHFANLAGPVFAHEKLMA
jgi:hypothetical protein